MGEKSIRLFIGAQLPSNLAQYLSLISQNYPLEQVKLVPAANLHLTLLFLGNVSASRLPSIYAQIAQISQQQLPFTLTLKEVSPGPNKTKPRLVWARFEASPEFERLCSKLAQAIDPAIQLPKQAIPHITIARISKNAALAGSLPLILPERKTEFRITEMSVWQSVLGSPHPAYTMLKTFPFALPAL